MLQRKFSVVFSVLASVQCARKERRVAVQASAPNVDAIACPVMAALVKRGIMNPDSVGRVDINETIKGLMATGGSPEVAGFQSLGIVGFEKSDTHQERRFTGPLATPSNKYLNLFTMNTADTCSGQKTTATGRPCNTNVPFQQHGFSTFIRDYSRNSNAESRFTDAFVRPGAFESISGVSEKVMTLAGLGRVLSYIRLNKGDYTGEFSLNPSGTVAWSHMSKYHPSVSSPVKYKPLSQWQPLLAWGAFWVAFARQKNGVDYITESDMRSFFIHGDFPADWKMKPWGFGKNFKALVQLKGKGVGDEWLSKLEGILQQAGPNPSEQVLAGLLVPTIRNMGTFDDDVYNTYGMLSSDGR